MFLDLCKYSDIKSRKDANNYEFLLKIKSTYLHFSLIFSFSSKPQSLPIEASDQEKNTQDHPDLSKIYTRGTHTQDHPDLLLNHTQEKLTRDRQGQLFHSLGNLIPQAKVNYIMTLYSIQLIKMEKII